MISSSIDRELANIHLLPFLYESIRDKRVLSIQYKPYEEELLPLIFHPHLLKEYNGRWFLFGHAVGMVPDYGFNLALDRIKGEPELMPLSERYIPAPKGFYSEFFRNIVGVSHIKGMEAEKIVIRATNHSIFRLTESKKIHRSQTTVKDYGRYADGEYGEFCLFVEPNNELIGRILQMGDGLVVKSPEYVRDMFRRRISGMADLYRD